MDREYIRTANGLPCAGWDGVDVPRLLLNEDAGILEYPGWVLDRRRDFAIMKALGASGRLLNGFFAAEAASLGVVGAVIGFVIGIGIAIWIGRVNFHAPVVPRFGVLPIVLLGSVVVALLSAALPISVLRRVEPAMILRGE